MTITISLDELRAHEKSINEWARKGMMEHAKSIITKMDSRMLMGSEAGLILKDAHEAVEKFEAENPAPKLIPAV